ncbi:YdeI/OmpD-associated family protein [Undibacterium sp. Di26W]|uniref:YdeI/OmpD-associated family protein n=1 Tax=Undibacterium sp. Di26W TaxID=3413035 RepID=UPI003BF342E2
MRTPKHNPKLDAYAETVEDFAKPILAHLRALIHATCPEVIEELKWGNPHFDYQGDMMCIFAAYKKHCSFTFYKDALMGDARLKANAGVPAAKRFMGKLTTIADLPSDKELKSWIKESMLLNEQGLKLPARESKTPKEVEMPAAFAEKLQVNPKIAKIFESQSASFQKEYKLWIGDAKTEATRDKRIEEAIAWIAEGKGRFWKYAK